MSLRFSLFPALVSLAMFGSMAHANETLDGKILAVDGDVVRIQSDAPLPTWIQQGVQVQAAGWEVPIGAVGANEFELHLGKARAGRLKLDSPLVIRSLTDELPVCG